MAIVNTTGGATGQLVGLDGQPPYAVDNDDAGFHKEDDSLLDLSPAELWRGQQRGSCRTAKHFAGGLTTPIARL